MAKCNEEERNIGHRERDLIRRTMEWRAMRREDKLDRKRRK
jgi:hypothetical protein